MSTEFKYDVIIVGGFGHVGLPLGIVLADRGANVALYDIDTSKRSMIEAGEMPFVEYGAEPILRRVVGKTLHIADSLADVAQSQTIIITIGTPIDEYLNPRFRPVFDLAEQMIPYLRSGQCVILRSTVYPGTTRSLNEFFKRQNCEVHLAYCPERIVQGYAIQELPVLPQIISGYTDFALDCSRELFESLGVKVVPVAVEEAELVKLFSNAWRYIQFAIANQFYMIATENGTDYARIYNAMTDGYERARDFPRPGFSAGPCLLKDTLQLTAFYNNHFQLGHAAMAINEGLPNFIVDHIIKDLDSDLNGVRVGILGMSFKADIDDIRDSLSYKLAKILRFHGAEVVASDEYVSDPTFVSKEEVLKTCRVIVVGIPHAAYKGLIVPEGAYVVDLWDVLQTRPSQQSFPTQGVRGRRVGIGK